MRTKFNGILTLLLAFFVQITFAQTRTISGTVSDESGALPGVSILKKGTNQGTETDFNGNFSISSKTGDILIFSFIGMKTVEKTVGTSNDISIKMETDEANTLDEVVLTGYTTTSKKKSSVASTTISSKSIENRPNASIVQTLSGQVPGLDISTSSGQPGSNSTVEIRGTNSVNGNVEPLFIMDGIPINEDNFRSLNPNEIESVSVLKDAGATAIYGSRGANGVVVIKTKRGEAGSKLQVNYNGVLSFSSLQGNKYDLLNSQQYLALERLTGRGRGAGLGNSLFPATGTPLTDQEIAAAETTNWNDVFFRTALTQNHTLSLSSGGKNSSQFTSIGYYDQEGILKGSNLKRFNLRNNLSGSSANERFNYSTTVSINYSKNDQPTSIGTSGVNQNPLFGANSSLPYYKPEDNPGSRVLAQDFLLAFAPFYILDKLDTTEALEEELKIVFGINGSYKITDDITASISVGGDYESIFDLDSQHPISRNQLRFNPQVDGFQVQSSNRTFSFNSTSSLSWQKTFGKHSIGFSAYLEYFKAHFRRFGFTQNGLNPKTFFPGDGDGFIPDSPNDDFTADTVFANVLNAGLLSYFGSLNYDFDGKYGVDAVLRRDASYRFSATNRWGTFWSVSGRWNISSESFMEDSVFNNLKLRASYGTAGNQRITGNTYFSGADLYNSLFNTNSGYNGQLATSLSQIGNNTLKWETVAQFNVGVDFGVFQNKLRGSIDYYRKKTTDLFQNLPISAVNATTGISANVGSLTNRGIDFQLEYDVVKNENFKLSVNTVGNYNKNKLQDLPSDNGEIIGLGRNGGSLREYYAVRYAGVNPANGNLLFLDANDNLTENPNPDTDRVWTGKNNRPDFQGSFGVNVDYKGFFFQTQFNYEVGIDRFDFDYSGYVDPNNIGSFNVSADLLRAWTPTNRVTDIPSLNASNLGVSNTDRFLVSADYLRLRFATLGYSLSKEQLLNTGFNKVKLFVNAENLFTLTKFRGFDASSRLTGREYPTPRTLSFGIELGL